MKVDNRFDNIKRASCGPHEKPLSARPVGDVLQGAAADCNSAAEIANFTRKINSLVSPVPADKTSGQTGNKAETLTPAWWIVPFAILGAAIWLRLIVGVMG